jgi:hypothetical protein
LNFEGKEGKNRSQEKQKYIFYFKKIVFNINISNKNIKKVKASKYNMSNTETRTSLILSYFYLIW